MGIRGKALVGEGFAPRIANKKSPEDEELR
jgi:hypothetical protein